MVHRSSLASRYQETSYKILTRWYRVPALLHKMDGSIPDCCWRCGAEGGTMMHIFWTCPSLRDFWREVALVIKELTSVEVGEDPALCLLHLTRGSIRKYRKSLIAHLLNAAKACIPAMWRQTCPPTRQMWTARVNEIHRMELLTAALNNSEEQTRIRWSPWLQFTSSDEYIQLNL